MTEPIFNTIPEGLADILKEGLTSKYNLCYTGETTYGDCEAGPSAYQSKDRTITFLLFKAKNGVCEYALVQDSPVNADIHVENYAGKYGDLLSNLLVPTRLGCQKSNVGDTWSSAEMEGTAGGIPDFLINDIPESLDDRFEIDPLNSNRVIDHLLQIKWLTSTDTTKVTYDDALANATAAGGRLPGIKEAMSLFIGSDPPAYQVFYHPIFSGLLPAENFIWTSFCYELSGGTIMAVTFSPTLHAINYSPFSTGYTGGTSATSGLIVMDVYP